MPRKPITPEIPKITNLHQEKEKFFSSNTYNPQFTYESPVDRSHLLLYGLPNNNIYEYSKNLIQRTLTDYGDLNKLSDLEGELLSLSETKALFDEHLSQNNTSNKLIIQYVNAQVARTNTSLTENDEIIMKIRLPIAYHKKSMQAVLDHEIGTHVFRWINDMQQPWYNHEMREKFSDYLITEEGLATLHWLLTHPVNFPLQQAIYYYTVFLGQDRSFRELFETLNALFNDPEYAWLLSLRVKRGYEDTEEPGSYTKDIVYLNGVKEVSQWLSRNDYKANDLYYGKIAIKDLDHIQTMDSRLAPLLPLFVKDSSYSDRIGRVIVENKFLSL